MNTAVLEKFWGQQKYKIYVVRLSHPKGKVKPEVRYVRVNAHSDTHEARQRAARVAVANSVDYSLGKPLNYSLRLAHPENDLGCVRSQPAASEAE